MLLFTLNDGDLIWGVVGKDICYSWLLVWKSLKCMN